MHCLHGVIKDKLIEWKELLSPIHVKGPSFYKNLDRTFFPIVNKIKEP